MPPEGATYAQHKAQSKSTVKESKAEICLKSKGILHVTKLVKKSERKLAFANQ